jgi:hypothetical protein
MNSTGKLGEFRSAAAAERALIAAAREPIDDRVEIQPEPGGFDHLARDGAGASNVISGDERGERAKPGMAIIL